MEQQRIFKLNGKVQHYAWGGTDYIPGLLQIDKEEGKKYAEYWLGAHPSASSELIKDQEQVSLHDLIEKDPAIYLGEEIYRNFHGLPFLFKVLDVKEMLSIQVHPSREEAFKGFEEEEAAGIPIDAPNRNYKDRNHKPEVMVALSEFWLLHGFKPGAELRRTLESEPEFRFLLPVFENGYKALYNEVMNMEQERTDAILLPLIERIYSNTTPYDRSQPEFWVKKLYGNDYPKVNLDRGIFSIYFFNIVHLHPGQAIFQGSGVPHAYLEGQNVELMANSDNVLRGGLTPKHIDVPELMKHIKFEGITPTVTEGQNVNSYERVFSCPVDDFAISCITIEKDFKYSIENKTSSIYLVTSGRISVDAVGPLSAGEAIYVIPGTELTFRAEERATIYKAFVPLSPRH
jgi:mannose-6-phosphate isomerase